MGRAATRKLSEDVELFSNRWQQLATYISQAVTEQRVDPKDEKEYLILTGELAKQSIPLATALHLDKSFVQKLNDLLEDIYCLRMLPDYQEFQMNLLRERWNTILIEVNSASSRRL